MQRDLIQLVSGARHQLRVTHPVAVAVFIVYTHQQATDRQRELAFDHRCDNGTSSCRRYSVVKYKTHASGIIKGFSQ